MRTVSPRTLIFAALFAATGAHAADLTGMNPGATIADFSGIAFGLDAGAGIGSAGPSSISGGIGGAHRIACRTNQECDECRSGHQHLPVDSHGGHSVFP